MQLSRNRSVMKAKAALEKAAHVRPWGQEKFSDSTFADVVRGAASAAGSTLRGARADACTRLAFRVASPRAQSLENKSS